MPKSGEAFTPRWKTATRSFFFGLGYALFVFGIFGPMLATYGYLARHDIRFVDLVSILLLCLLCVLLSLLALRLTRSPGRPSGLKAILRWEREEIRAAQASKGLPPRDRYPDYVQEQYSGWVAVIAWMLGAFVATLLLLRIGAALSL